MLVHTEAGDTFTFAEIARWLREAGFVQAAVAGSAGAVAAGAGNPALAAISSGPIRLN